MITINLQNNNIGRVFCSLELLNKLRKEFRLRADGYFYSPKFRSRQWDGYVHYIRESGIFDLGMFPMVYAKLGEWGEEINIVDQRTTINVKPKLPKELGNFKLRDYQMEGVKMIINNKVGGVPFPRGLIHQATNAGKNLLAASIYAAYKKPNTLFIVNRTHIYEQAMEELGELYPEDIGHIGPKSGSTKYRGVKWGNFMVCMIQSIAHLDTPQISQFQAVIVDECHYASTFKWLLNRLPNAYIKIGMSGTINKHKDKNKNQKIISYFGDILHKITNAELIDKGHSTPVRVTILNGNTTVNVKGDFKKEETLGLIFNKERNKKAIKRITYQVGKGRLPILVICKYHNHTEHIYEKIKINFPELNTDYIHVGVKDRLEILQKFKEGKIDMLVSSLLIKEGKNLPLIRYLCYLAGGDSMITLLQVLGRLLRKHSSKSIVYFDDFYDIGSYLKRHSNHRIKEFKKEKLKVIEKYSK